MRLRIHALVGILAFLGSAAAVIHADDPVVPVYHEPHHRQVFQYGTTRILDVQIPPGDISWYHIHASPILYVTLSAGRIQTQNLGQDWGAGGRGQAGRGAPPAGEGAPPVAPPPGARISSTTSYTERPVTHRVKNVGDTLFHPIGVINESPGDDSTAEPAGFEGKLELANRWFRAFRFTLAPGASTSSHHHQSPVVVVQSSDGRAVGAGAVKWELNEQGRWAFFDKGDAHTLRNVGESGVELIEVEVRQPH
jgi:quercetin dioxygenase-like cupin family protein